MDATWYDTWLDASPPFAVSGGLLVLMIVAAMGGTVLRARLDRLAEPGPTESQEGYIVSAVLGFLALLLAFTFSLAVDRFDTRRARVLEGANAISTAYVRAQLLGEPHRARLSDILVRYTNNGVLMGAARPGDLPALFAKDDALLTELGAAMAAGFDSIRNIDFSTSLVESVNDVINMDAARRAARAAQVPAEVFLVLFIYLVVTAGVLGYVLTGSRGRLAAGFLLILALLSLMLVLDIDRPSLGGVRESQAPMEDLQKRLAAQPPAVFDIWRTPARPTP